MAKVPLGQAARATRTVSAGMVPSSWGYIDMDILLPDALFANFFLLLYHSSIPFIRQQSPERGEILRHTPMHWRARFAGIKLLDPDSSKDLNRGNLAKPRPLF